MPHSCGFLWFWGHSRSVVTYVRTCIVKYFLKLMSKTNCSVLFRCSDVCNCLQCLTLLVGRQEEHPVCKNWVISHWHGYLSQARCKWFAYRPADATATPSSFASLKSRLIYPFWCGLPCCHAKDAIKQMSAVTCVWFVACEQKAVFKHFPELQKFALTNVASIDTRDSLLKHFKPLTLDSQLLAVCL